MLSRLLCRLLCNTEMEEHAVTSCDLLRYGLECLSKFSNAKRSFGSCLSGGPLGQTVPSLFCASTREKLAEARWEAYICPALVTFDS